MLVFKRLIRIIMIVDEIGENILYQSTEIWGFVHTKVHIISKRGFTLFNIFYLSKDNIYQKYLLKGIQMLQLCRIFMNQKNVALMNYDIAIIGGGPAGYNAAYRAVESGMNTLLFEPSELGGVCLNQGCIPTKTLLYSAKLLDQSKLAEKYGILGTGQASFDLSKMIGRKNKVVKK